MSLPSRLILRSSRSLPRSYLAAKSFNAERDIVHKTYATSSRKAVTVVNDDGRVKWGKLSAREKAARTTQQSINFAVIIAGVVMTCGVATLLYLEVFSLDSKVSHFNRAVDRIRQDSRCTAVLGDAKHIKAYGEPTWNKWSRNRAIASRVEKDRIGSEHLYVDFNVEGPLGKGRAHIHLVKRQSESDYTYRYLYVDVKGQHRIYLENEDERADKRPSGKIFGVKWW